MTALIGQLTRPTGYSYVDPYLSIELRQLDDEGFLPVAYSAARMFLRPLTTHRSAAATPRVVIAHAPRSTHDDFYFRIHVRPAVINLGNLASSQTRQVYVWNAFPGQSHTMTGADLLNAEGITLTTPGALPLNFAPLQEREFDLAIDTYGPPVIDATVVFTFTGLDNVTVNMTGNRLLAWPLPPDWSNDLDESLEWLTDLEHSVSGDRTAQPCREAPRREWEFNIVEGRRERRILENLLYDWSARVWSLPVWTDVEWLSAPLAAGAIAIPVVTADLDFVVGGLAMLWSDVQRYELVEVSAIEPTRILLLRPTQSAWAPGTRLYPCRNARLTESPQIKRKNDRVITSRARFQSDEPCDWPAVAPAATYLGIPVLEQRPDEEQDPEASYDRVLVTLDGDVGLIAVDDVTQLAWQRQSHAWKPHGRRERAALRSLLYWLQGRAEVLWLPTWADDVELVEPTGSVGESLVVAWAGIGQYLRQQVGRRHLRIETFAGAIYYRRVAGIQQIDADRERLLLDAPIGVALMPSTIRLICWMTLSHQAADRNEIGHEHESKGTANARTSFVAAGLEEP